MPDRVVTLASLSERIASRFVAEVFCRTLHAETGATVLMLKLQLADAPASLRDWGRVSEGGEFSFTRFLDDIIPGEVSRLRLRVSGEASEVEWLEPLVRHCASHFQFVVVHLDVETPVPLLLECLAVATRTFLLLQATTEDLYHRDLLFREIQNHPRGASSNVRAIVCREKDEPQSSELLKQMGSTAHGFIHGCPPPALLWMPSGRFLSIKPSPLARRKMPRSYCWAIPPV